jgi:hypothetical protein
MAKRIAWEKAAALDGVTDAERDGLPYAQTGVEREGEEVRRSLDAIRRSAVHSLSERVWGVVNRNRREAEPAGFAL